MKPKLGIVFAISIVQNAKLPNKNRPNDRIAKSPLLLFGTQIFKNVKKAQIFRLFFGHF
jgi:hypothetical protein